MTLDQAKQMVEKYKDWIPVEQLPDRTMLVKWLCEDGVEDIGIYYHERREFATWDKRSDKPIILYKPNPQP